MAGDYRPAMPNEPRDPKTPSAADIMRKRAADEAAHATDEAARRPFVAAYRETGLTSLALYQQALRTAERIKTLRREIDDISRELHERLDDLDIIIEKIQGNSPLNLGDTERIRRQIEALDISAVDDELRNAIARNWPHLLAKLPRQED